MFGTVFIKYLLCLVFSPSVKVVHSLCRIPLSILLYTRYVVSCITLHGFCMGKLRTIAD